MGTHDDGHGSGTDRQHGRPPQQYGRPPHGVVGAEAGERYGGQQDQPSPYGPPAYAQGQPIGQSGYWQYGQPGGYGPYAPQGQYGQHGQALVPARPTPVVVAAVLGFVFSALGALVALGELVGGALAGTVMADLIASDPELSDVDPAELGEFTDLALLFGIGLGVLALLWTALMVWGSVWALTGRSRVLLLVGGSVAVAATASLLFAVLSGLSTGEVGVGEVLVVLPLFLAALAIVVLLSLRPAARYYAAHRARRGR